MSSLFRFFDKMNAGDFGYIDKMTDEEVKELSPYVLLMWMNGAQDNPEIHVMMTDMICNPYVFSLNNHPRLLLKLFVAANGEIDSSRYKFEKSEGMKASKQLKAIATYYQCTLKDAAGYVSLLGEEGIKEITDRIPTDEFSQSN